MKTRRKHYNLFLDQAEASQLQELSAITGRPVADVLRRLVQVQHDKLRKHVASSPVPEGARLRITDEGGFSVVGGGAFDPRSLVRHVPGAVYLRADVLGFGRKAARKAGLPTDELLTQMIIWAGKQAGFQWVEPMEHVGQVSRKPFDWQSSPGQSGDRL